MLLPNMVIAGKACPVQAPVADVAQQTVRYLRRYVPAAVPGIVFLSGGQDHLAATVHLNAANQIDARPWTVSFSCGRALQDEALNTWRGSADRLAQGQQDFHHRAKCGSAAALGRYTPSMEREAVVA